MKAVQTRNEKGKRKEDRPDTRNARKVVSLSLIEKAEMTTISIRMIQATNSKADVFVYNLIVQTPCIPLSYWSRWQRGRKVRIEASYVSVLSMDSVMTFMLLRQSRRRFESFELPYCKH